MTDFGQTMNKSLDSFVNHQMAIPSAPNKHIIIVTKSIRQRYCNKYVTSLCFVTFNQIVSRKLSDTVMASWADGGALFLCNKKPLKTSKNALIWGSPSGWIWLHYLIAWAFCGDDHTTFMRYSKSAALWSLWDNQLKTKSDVQIDVQNRCTIKYTTTMKTYSDVSS